MTRGFKRGPWGSVAANSGAKLLYLCNVYRIQCKSMATMIYISCFSLKTKTRLQGCVCRFKLKTRRLDKNRDTDSGHSIFKKATYKTYIKTYKNLYKNIYKTYATYKNLYKTYTNLYKTYKTYIKPIKTYIKPIKTYIKPIKTYIKPIKTYIKPIKTYIKPIKPI